jgi:CRISPR-associated endonuclease Cas1
MADSDRTNRAARLSSADVADIGTELDRVFSRDATNTDIAVLDGAGCALRVQYGSLVAEDGIGRHRRIRRWTRAMPPSRVVVLSDSGFLALDALSWCEHVGTKVLGIDPHSGRVRYESTASSSKRDRRLVRAQAVAGMADDHPIGLAIVQRLLRSKLAGESHLARGTLEIPETADTIDALAHALDDVTSIDQARQLEASAAAAYFAGWVNHPATQPRFADRDRDRIPSHWLRFDGRRSVLGAGNSNRRAERPVNGILNFLFAVAKAECVLACRIVGLDPDLGLLHLDSAGRPSMALDICEPLRPRIEAFVLELVAQRVFRRVDFLEAPDGAIRLGIGLRHELVATLPRWATLVAPHAEAVARALTELVATDYRTSAPLTGTRRRQATARIKARKAAAGAARLQNATRTPKPQQDPLPLAPTCVQCGGQLSRDRHQRCPSCWATQPGQDEPTRRKRGRAIAASRAELERWKSEHPDARTDPDTFRREILPTLQRVKLADIMRATGMAKSSASMVRSGVRVPALRHWDALAARGDRKDNS